jgi:hypothetical protein
VGLQSVAGTSNAVVSGPRIPNFQGVDTRVFIMSDEQTAIPEAIPDDLRDLIHLNRKYCVLSCVECKEAVGPGALV